MEKRPTAKATFAHFFPRRNKAMAKSVIDEDARIWIQSQISAFLSSPDETMDFPAHLSSDQRKYIHTQVVQLGLQSKSYGKHGTRRLTLYKSVVGNKINERQENILCFDSLQIVEKYVRSNPSSLDPSRMCTKFDNHSTNKSGGSRYEKLDQRFIPPKFGNHKFRKERESLPIYSYKLNIMDAINENRVIIINGETGSGKTTQLPQYILEQAADFRTPCRIICTQPRRIAAISIAERVAQERGEPLGTTVGYQIRFEGCVRNTSNLIYTTGGCMIRSLMQGVSDTFLGITHIIIDEVHERDKNTDFLLISLRDEIKTNKNLKIILMSATMDINLLQNYFDNCPIVNVPGRCYETSLYFLEDILDHTKYQTKQMRTLLSQMESQANNIIQQQLEGKRKPSQNEQVKYKYLIDNNYRNNLDAVISRCLLYEHSYRQFVGIVERDNIPIDYQHSQTGMTALIAAAIINNVKMIKILISLNADLTIKDSHNLSAIDYSKRYPDKECFNYLTMISENLASSSSTASASASNNIDRLLNVYQQQFNDDEEIDHDLLVKLIKYIHNFDNKGSILVFLPGYSDIMKQKDLIEQEIGRNQTQYELFLLHSHMQSQYQKRVLRPTASRKIILSTNIAETSVTIPDVAFVVDTGKVKQNTYDSITGSSYLISSWISKACAMQRSGRAGRTQNGICYRMFTKKKYNSMDEFTLPEILRISLTELCLYAKAINTDNTSILEYLMKSLQPPTQTNICNAVEKLKLIGAIDANENLTILGKYLVDIPLEVQLGKCLLFAIMFQCLDPVLTIVSYLSVKDPFVLPSLAFERNKASEQRKQFSKGYLSDHMGIVQLYNEWQKSRSMNDRNFCYDNFLSITNLEMISAVRDQIADHLKRLGMFDRNKQHHHLLNYFSDDWMLVKACLTAGFYPNICYIDKKKYKISSNVDNTVLVHQSSVLRGAPNTNQKRFIQKYPVNWIIYNEKSRSGAVSYIKYNSLITPITLALFSGLLISSTSSSSSSSSSNQLNGNNSNNTQIFQNPDIDNNMIYNDDDDDDDHDDDDDNDDNYNSDDVDIDDNYDHMVNYWSNNNACGSSLMTPPNKFIIDDWISLTLCPEETRLLTVIKNQLSEQFLKFLKNTKTWPDNINYDLFKTIREILKREENQSFEIVNDNVFQSNICNFSMNNKPRRNNKFHRKM